MITVIFSTRKPEFWRVLQQDEVPGYIPESRDTAPYPPMVFTLEPFHKVWMDRAFQEFWFSLNRSDDIVKDKRAWLNYTAGNKAFCNQSGIMKSDKLGGGQQSADFINNTGLNLQFGKIGTYVSGREKIAGKEVKLQEKTGNYPPGKWTIALNTIRPGHYRNITRARNPELVHIGKIFITGRLAPDGLTWVNAFPERGGREGFPVYFPVISNVQMYFDRERVVRMRDDEPQPVPYNPP